MTNKFKLTEQGLAEYQAELKVLIGRRPEIAENIKVAREQGDLKENAEYQAARDEQSQVEDKISELESILKNYELISAGKNRDVVELGESVVIESQDGKQRTLIIAGSLEADPTEGKISDESPMGKAMLGKKIGEEFEVNGKKYTIKRVE
ncbi:MAG TPA: transcription elongation factor GreA [Candidatus Saccharibacteria bacterium]|nr:transcription elongation factor GreA [Candidatus Saccharibacteria bacterium]